ncbi:hypothetical protein N7478_001766 [Penicillium angulare]|uniref:uncharacterized protein n=1 Tax=Penicillium angulare TaxID=116970 RepID=UPI00253FCB32|nr:uncharacterized protein N7478_001766 [Penicillium angulare]KAJ5288736.1 hypothetical protein N7478_001766 [Penicillium angulare]
MSEISSSPCTHSSIRYTSSSHARVAGFKRPGKPERLAAANAEGASSREKPFLDDNPNEWLDEEDRNPVTSKRRTIYVVSPPTFDDQVSFMESWTSPQGLGKGTQTQSPNFPDVCEYLSAFYHGLPVKALPRTALQFTCGMREIVNNVKATSTSWECVRIRTRPCPDGIYRRQLDTNDLLDAAISILPKDAYALLLLVDHDLYEDEDDTFICGRAYGGSRVAVVSSVRYNPDLDEAQFIERVHAWPLSHCAVYISACCSTSMPKAKRPGKSEPTEGHQPKTLEASTDSESPVTSLDAAFTRSSTIDNSNMSQESLTALWLGRICRTTSHELGHCFGIDHCVYYACCMQGTSCLCEDTRQPPYLCPVDQAKLLHVTEVTEAQRNHALVSFCERPEFRETHFFAPFTAWLRTRLS